MPRLKYAKPRRGTKETVATDPEQQLAFCKNCACRIKRMRGDNGRWKVWIHTRSRVHWCEGE